MGTKDLSDAIAERRGLWDALDDRRPLRSLDPLERQRVERVSTRRAKLTMLITREIKRRGGSWSHYRLSADGSSFVDIRERAK
jgi:hypothetical protein